MQFAYKKNIAVYALLSAARHLIFQGLFIMNRRHCSTKKEYFTYAIKMTFKREVDTSLENIILRNGFIHLYCVRSNVVTSNNTHTMN